MRKPVIGITPGINYEKDDIALSPAYIKCIGACGGFPVILPMMSQREWIDSAVGLCDGFLFSGGRDVSPRMYGEETRDICGFVEEERDRYETELMRAVLKSGKPLLAVCRGIQLLNVFFGGTLYQDIYAIKKAKVDHSMKVRSANVCHKISILPRTPFSKIFDTPGADVNSYHHQAIKDLGRGLRIGALSSEDNIIEGVYIPGHRFALGVQWHPELLTESCRHSRRLFEEFVNSCTG